MPHGIRRVHLASAVVQFILAPFAPPLVPLDRELDDLRVDDDELPGSGSPLTTSDVNVNNNNAPISITLNCVLVLLTADVKPDMMLFRCERTSIKRISHLLSDVMCVRRVYVRRNS